MFPLMVIGGVIGAMMSIGKGASWVSDQLHSATSSGSAGGKDAPAAATNAKAGSFDAALAAQTAGPSVPAVAVASATAPAPMLVPHAHAGDYDQLARMKAGVEAYNTIGEHHRNHAGAIKSGVDGSPAAPA